MARLRFRLKGQPREITFPVFVAAAVNALKVLSEFDAAIAGEPRGTLEWVVADLQVGSLVVEIESVSKLEDRNVGPEVTHAFVSGLALIERQGVTPPYLSETGMQRARKLVKLIGEGGTSGLEVSDFDETVDISAQASANIDQLLKIRKHSVGSVEGKIETISIHGRPRVIVYQSRTRKAISCNFPKDRAQELMQTAKDVLGARVNVTGVIHSNARGEPMRVEVSSIRRLLSKDELPTIADMSGSDPAFTGDMSTAEYLRSIRIG